MSDDKTPEFDKFLWQHAAENLPPILTDAEIERLVTLLCYSNREVGGGDASASEEEIGALLGWANGTRAMQQTLDNLLDGHMYVSVKDGQPQFQLTPKGRALAEDVARRMGLPVDRLPPEKDYPDA
jgi:hypothetical protein